MEKLVFKQPITDSAKLKFLEFYCNEGYDESIQGLFNYFAYGFHKLRDYPKWFVKKLKALDIWEEPEPNYNDWIGEDCVFSDYPIDRNNEVFIGVFTSHKVYRFVSNEQDSWKYCMLKKDYVKLLKEQSK